MKRRVVASDLVTSVRMRSRDWSSVSNRPGSKPTGPEQHKLCDAGGLLHGHLLHDHAAHGMTEQIDPIDAQRIERAVSPVGHRYLRTGRAGGLDSSGNRGRDLVSGCGSLELVWGCDDMHSAILTDRR